MEALVRTGTLRRATTLAWRHIVALLSAPVRFERMLRWGTTPEERAARLPGDLLVPSPRVEATRAIEIAATPGDVWPWLSRLGGASHAPGGGWPLEETNALRVGDHLAMPGSPWTWCVTELARERYLVLHAMVDLVTGSPLAGRPTGRHLEVSWSFVLQALEDGNTRLSVRTRVDHDGGLRSRLWWGGLALPVLYVRERELLEHLREQSEAYVEPPVHRSGLRLRPAARQSKVA